MPISSMSISAVTCEMYRRSIQARRNGTASWEECLDIAKTSVLLELDYWIMAPGAAQ